MRTSNLMPTTSASPWVTDNMRRTLLPTVAESRREQLAVTSAVLRAFRRGTWTITEERSAIGRQLCTSWSARRSTTVVLTTWVTASPDESGVGGKESRP